MRKIDRRGYIPRQWAILFDKINKVEIELEALLEQSHTLSVVDCLKMRNKLCYARTTEKRLSDLILIHDIPPTFRDFLQLQHSFQEHVSEMMFALGLIEIKIQDVEISLQNNTQHSPDVNQCFLPSIHSFSRTTADCLGAMLHEDNLYNNEQIKQIVKMTSETLAETLYAAEKSSTAVMMLDGLRAHYLSVLQENERLRNTAPVAAAEKQQPSIDMLNSSLNTLIKENQRLREENAALNAVNKVPQTTQENRSNQPKIGQFFLAKAKKCSSESPTDSLNMKQAHN